MTNTILRLPAVLRERGRSRSAHYFDIQQGLFTHPVQIGLRAVGWPTAEVAAINAARIAGIFACRHCYKLAYACQRETPDDRAARRADRIRDRLGWEAGILNGEGVKPKGMHWRTFKRLHAEHNDFVNASLAGMMRKFGRLGVGLDDLLDDR